jgi:stalled ribosome alternative rescue factor ArfA
MKVSKELDKTGKFAFDGPKVKDRKKFAPATKAEKPKKGKGSFVRNKKSEEDEEEKDDKKESSVASKKNKKRFVKESVVITNFIEAVLEKNHADAYKYLQQAVDLRLQSKIEDLMNKPLF